MKNIDIQLSADVSKRMAKLDGALDKLIGALKSSNLDLADLSHSPIFAQMALGNNTLVRAATAQAALWERRRLAWLNRYLVLLGYTQALQVYSDLSDRVAAIGMTPDRAVMVETGQGFEWRGIKEIAEQILGNRLPDIKPDDAIELAKTTPFSAEQWYIGCTDKYHQITD